MTEGARDLSLDTWQQIDTSRSIERLLDRFDSDWRPSSASTFGLEPTDEAAGRAYFARLIAETPPPPPLWADLPAPPELDARAIMPAREADDGTSKLLRNDAAKIELGATIARGSAERWAAGAANDAIWLEKRSSAMGLCRTVRAFRDAGCGSYLARPNSCRVRVCPDCERSRAARLAQRFAGLSIDMARPVFWTFTVPNVTPDRLELGIDWLLEAFRRLRRRAIFTGGLCRGDPSCRGHSAAHGGVYSLEITWNAERVDWHPHVHVLADLPFVLWSEMRAAWRAVTCDAIRYLEQGGGRVRRCRHPVDELGRPRGACRGASVLWVRAVKGAPGSPERLAAVREALKYTVGGLVKSDGTLDGAPDARLADLLLALRNRRLVAGWGDWRNVTDEDAEDELPGVLLGADVLPALRGLPINCPACGHEALWELPIDIPRRSCYLAADRTLRWRPPPAARA